MSVADVVRDFHHRANRSFDMYVERTMAHPRVQVVLKNPHVQKGWDLFVRYKVFDVFCRFLITSYFLNMAYYNLDVYFNYNPHNTESLSIFTLSRVPFALAYLFNFRGDFAGAVLCTFAGLDSFLIFQNQILRHSFVITELIVKKLAIFGSCLLLVVEFFKAKLHFSETPDPDAGLKKTAKQSAVILVARLLISSIFLFIGIVEINRQLQTAGHWYSSSSSHHARPAGDGHDQIFYKIVQFLLCIPIIVGYQSKLFALLLSFSSILEAFTQWNWIGVEIQNWKFYPIHARDHFFTNLGVAGGLLLLFGIGAGAYSVDSWLKKRE
jgi:uncharacterized membrane protein YphA (DoxX/SURF4 family)